MTAMSLVLVLFAVGIGILVAEIFLPSHGLLILVGLGFLIAGIYEAYVELGTTVGHLFLLAAIILLPTLSYIAIKTFHRTPWGQKLAPPNPTSQVSEFAPQVDQLKNMVGLKGQTLTPLRPIGTCRFNDQRVNCVTESQFIDSGVSVEVIRVQGAELVVRSVHS